MLPRAGLYPGSDLANRRNVWMFSFLPPKLAESGGIAPQSVARPVRFRGDAGTLVRFTLQDGGGRTSRSPVGFHRPHAFPMRAGPRPVRPPKWPPRRAKRAMHAERRTAGAGRSPEFRLAKRVNCTRRRSAPPSYGGQARTYDVRSVAGCLLPHAEKVVRPPGFAPGLFLVRTEADCLVADGRVASVTGIAPACIRLEDGALICSRHTESELELAPTTGISPAASSFGGMRSDN